MRIRAQAFLIIAAALIVAAPATADEVLTVAADSTLAGQAGFVVHSTPTSGVGSSIFLVEEAGMIRFFATRDYGSPVWDLVASAQYVVKAGPLTIGDTWDFVDNESGGATTARVAAAEDVTVGAGTFSCFRVDIENVAEPGVVQESMWFAAGVGFVRNQGYLNGLVDWRDDLASSTVVGGTGNLPLAVGNSWDYTEVSVPNEDLDWGELKALYR